MGIENPVHLLFIAIVALIVLGPKRLPEVARALGHGLREFREAVSGQADQTITQRAAAVQQPIAAQQPADADAQASTAFAPPQAVDPAEQVRSGDASDRGPL
jgi:TatA/E family protein of Tat protein translocase